MDWKLESTMFDRTARYYDKYRPGYPEEIINALIEKTGIEQGSKLLEIGSGSGKATNHFAPKGYDILCIDPGEQLVEAGRKKFESFGNVRFEVARFEEYDAPEGVFDVVFSAQSFHWVPQSAGYQECARVLKKGGYLAPFWNMYITYDNALDNELMEISDRYGGIADFLSESGCEERIATIVSGIAKSGLFGTPEVHRVPWKERYSPDDYFGFMLTGNAFVRKTDEEKERAYRDILNLAGRNGGIIERPYLCVLYIAKKI